MTAYHQRVETALRLVDQHLADMLNPTVYSREDLDEALCADHCGSGGCDRTEQQLERELDDVANTIRKAVSVLQVHLRRHGREDYGVDVDRVEVER